jgi:hypothetical protein
MINTCTDVLLYRDYGLSIDIVSRVFLMLLLLHMQGLAAEIEML